MKRAAVGRRPKLCKLFVTPDDCAGQQYGQRHFVAHKTFAAVAAWLERVRDGNHVTARTAPAVRRDVSLSELADMMTHWKRSAGIYHARCALQQFVAIVARKS